MSELRKVRQNYFNSGLHSKYQARLWLKKTNTSDENCFINGDWIRSHGHLLCVGYVWYLSV